MIKAVDSRTVASSGAGWGQLVRPGVAGLASGALFAAIVFGYAAGLLIVRSGAVALDLLSPLALTLSLAAFGQPTGFRVESGTELTGVGLEFVPMPWVALGVVVAGLGWRFVLGPPSKRPLMTMASIGAFAGAFAFSLGIAAAALVSSTNDGAVPVRHGVDVASFVARALIVATIVALVLEWRRHSGDWRVRLSGRFSSGLASGGGALLVVAVVAGAVGVAAVADHLVLGERLLVLAATPLILVNVGGIALALVVDAPVVGGVASSIGETVTTTRVGAGTADAAFGLLAGDRSLAAGAVLFAMLVIVAVVGWRLQRRLRPDSVGEGLGLGIAMAFGFAFAGWLVGSLAGIHAEAFSFEAGAVTRPVVSFSADVSPGRLFAGLFVPAAAVSCVVAGLSGWRRRLPLRTAGPVEQSSSELRP